MKALTVLLAITLAARAEDWPTYQHDYQRSGASAESLIPPLAPAWTFPAQAQPSAPAWPQEAEYDEYAKGAKLKPRFTFDRYDCPAIVGDRVFVGSAARHTVRSLDSATGAMQWTFFADGPVRMAPSVDGGRVYFGADDGAAYCLDAASGALIWKIVAAAEGNYLVPNDGRFVSPFAVRTGVAVESGTAYFGAGLFPSEGVWLCAVDAATGKPTKSTHWRQRFVNEGSLQGALLLSPDRVIVPGGRGNPWSFERETGKLEGQFKEKKAMGTFALLAGNTLLFGPASRGGAAIAAAGFDFKTVTLFAEVSGATVTSDRLFLTSDKLLTALDRNTQARVWSVKAAHPYALIVAGDILYAGGDDEVAAFSVKNGARLWTGKVPGRAGGLAVASGRLYVSTDRGQLHVFAPVNKP